jgi:riboflavin kinase/FMN adenylyltransferase
MIVHKLDYQSKGLKADLALCLGFFDGVHRAHQKLFQDTLSYGNSLGVETAIMTFSTHIGSYIANREFKALSMLDDKIRIAREMGFDHFYIIRVSEELARMAPESFIERFLMSSRLVIVGFDYSFGAKGRGDVAMLQRWLPEKVHVVLEMDYYGKKIGSSRVRRALSEGRIPLANRMLGGAYQIHGTVIKGHGRGKDLGFPTANIAYNGYFLPRHGVYHTEVVLRGEVMHSMSNIGCNPTFHNREVTLETHIFDFDDTIYGESITLRFKQYIRPEKVFASSQALIAQMAYDEEVIKKAISQEVSNEKIR